jgi:hypothetical protein
MEKPLCECGCGRPVTFHKKKRQYNRFIHGHHKGNWKGGRIIDCHGYAFILMPNHPQSNNKGYVREHILVMEKALRRRILPSEHIHHIDGSRQNNDPGNLLIFQTNAMHVAYEARLRAFKSSGNYEWRQCGLCHKYDSPKNLIITNTNASHPYCKRDYWRKKNWSGYIGGPDGSYILDNVPDLDFSLDQKEVSSKT